MRGSVKPVAQALGSISNTWLLNKRAPQEFLGLPVSLPASDLILASAWQLAPCRIPQFILQLLFFQLSLCLTLLYPFTIARQTPLSMGFLHKNTGASCHFLLQRSFLTETGSRFPTLLANSLPLSHQWNPQFLLFKSFTFCPTAPLRLWPAKLGAPFLATRVGTFKDAHAVWVCACAWACTYSTLAVATTWRRQSIPDRNC